MTEALHPWITQRLVLTVLSAGRAISYTYQDPNTAPPPLRLRLPMPGRHRLIPSMNRDRLCLTVRWPTARWSHEMKKKTLRGRNGMALGKQKPSQGATKCNEPSARNNVAPGRVPNDSSAQANGYLCCIAPDVKVGNNVKFSKFINLYGCEVGDDTKIGAFVEIQKNAKVGNRCKISSHTFICEGVTIEDEVFVGHNVTFVNDSFPRATSRQAHSRPSGLESRSHVGQKRCVDWIGSNHPGECGDRRKCVDRRRVRGDSRRAGERNHGRQSRESSA